MAGSSDHNDLYDEFEATRRWLSTPRPSARLNLGDCFAYVLAKATGEPLLYKGEDFGLTDVEAAG